MTVLLGAVFLLGALLSTELVLDGVILAANPAESLALVRRAEAERARILRVGESYQGLVLAEIAKDSVRFEGPEGPFRLFLPGSRPDVEAPPVSSSDSSDETWVRRAFSREAARERFTREIPVILSDTDLEPCIEEGEVQGLSVARLPDGTLLSESGLLPGDVLVSINGEPLRDVESLWELISRLIDEEEIRVVVRRRNELLKLAYAFTN